MHGEGILYTPISPLEAKNFDVALVFGDHCFRGYVFDFNIPLFISFHACPNTSSFVSFMTFQALLLN